MTHWIRAMCNDTAWRHGRRALLVPMLLAGILAAGCAPSPTPSATADPSPPSIGGERDPHGCLASAGYRWCARTARCERPWELARAQGFENSDDAYMRWCQVPPNG